MAQLVARYLGVVEAAGSSPVTQTKKTLKTLSFQGLFSVLLRKILWYVTQFATQICVTLLFFTVTLLAFIACNIVAGDTYQKGDMKKLPPLILLLFTLRILSHK